jgi:hypothetical protein
VNYYTFLAREVREYMAEMGFRRFEDMIGRTDMIEVDERRMNDKTRTLDFSRLLAIIDNGNPIHAVSHPIHKIYDVLDRDMIESAIEGLAAGQNVSLAYDLINTHRAVGAMLSGEIARRYGGEGLPDGSINVHFKGSAGQSFGASSCVAFRSRSKERPTTIWARGFRVAASASTHRATLSLMPHVTLLPAIHCCMVPQVVRPTSVVG